MVNLGKEDIATTTKISEEKAMEAKDMRMDREIEGLKVGMDGALELVRQ